MPMMRTSVVSLNRPMKVLTMPGMTIFSACGRTIEPHHLPVAEARAHAPPRTGPCGIACSPPRTTSAM